MKFLKFLKDKIVNIITYIITDRDKEKISKLTSKEIQALVIKDNNNGLVYHDKNNPPIAWKSLRIISSEYLAYTNGLCKYSIVFWYTRRNEKYETKASVNMIVFYKKDYKEISAFIDMDDYTYKYLYERDL